MDSSLLTDDSRTLTNEQMCPVEYDDIIAACNGENYTMSLTADEDVVPVIDAVNMGIDSRLQACYVPARGDSYEGGIRKAGDKVIARTLECSISPESLPVLLNRLFDADCCSSLAASILYSLGFNDSGKLVGREANGLE